MFQLRVVSEPSQDGFRRAGGIPDAPIEDDGWTHDAWLGKGTADDDDERFPQSLGEFPTLAAAIAAAKEKLGMNVSEDEPTALYADAAGEV
jgi:hypothetical protein